MQNTSNVLVQYIEGLEYSEGVHCKVGLLHDSLPEM